VRRQLVALDLQTGARRDPPDGHWRRAAARMRLALPDGTLGAEKLREVQEAVALYRSNSVGAA
jgi:hypothetical protein